MIHNRGSSLEVELVTREDLDIVINNFALLHRGGNGHSEVGPLGRPADGLHVLVVRGEKGNLVEGPGLLHEDLAAGPAVDDEDVSTLDNLLLGDPLAGVLGVDVLGVLGLDVLVGVVLRHDDVLEVAGGEEHVAELQVLELGNSSIGGLLGLHVEKAISLGDPLLVSGDVEGLVVGGKVVPSDLAGDEHLELGELSLVDDGETVDDDHSLDVVVEFWFLLLEDEGFLFVLFGFKHFCVCMCLFYLLNVKYILYKKWYGVKLVLFCFVYIGEKVVII